MFLILAESEEEEFFECTSEEPSNEDDSTRTQLKAKHLLWNKPAGRLAKHPSLKYIIYFYFSVIILLLLYNLKK